MAVPAAAFRLLKKSYNCRIYIVIWRLDSPEQQPIVAQPGRRKRTRRSVHGQRDSWRVAMRKPKEQVDEEGNNEAHFFEDFESSDDGDDSGGEGFGEGV
jgi:hypothetical protein